MSRRLAAVLIGGSVLVIVVALLLLSLGDRNPSIASGEDSSSAAASSGEMATFELYFPGPGGLLHREARELPLARDPLAQARTIVEAVVAGPQGNSLIGPFPAGTELRAIDAGPAGSLFVSLGTTPGTPEQRFAMGSRAELLTLYSLVDSLAFNIEGVERVAILWNGVQPQTLAGHVDTSMPLRPSRTWVAQ